VLVACLCLIGVTQSISYRALVQDEWEAWKILHRRVKPVKFSKKLMHFDCMIFRKELHLRGGRKVPLENIHGKQGKDCKAQSKSSSRRSDIFYEDESFW